MWSDLCEVEYNFHSNDYLDQSSLGFLMVAANVSVASKQHDVTKQTTAFSHEIHKNVSCLPLVIKYLIHV